MFFIYGILLKSKSQVFNPHNCLDWPFIGRPDGWQDKSVDRFSRPMCTKGQTKLHLIGSKMIYAGSYPKSGISFERNHIFLSTVLTKSLGDAFPMRRLRVFYPFVTTLHAVDTLVPARLLKKCYKVSSIAHFIQIYLWFLQDVPLTTKKVLQSEFYCPLCSDMLMIFAKRALDAKW